MQTAEAVDLKQKSPTQDSSSAIEVTEEERQELLQAIAELRFAVQDYKQALELQQQ